MEFAKLYFMFKKLMPVGINVTYIGPGCLQTYYHILLSKVCTFYMEKDAEIYPVHYTWKVAEKRFKMASMMNKLTMINSCQIILEK